LPKNRHLAPPGGCGHSPCSWYFWAPIKEQ
jgi:hypothetical protein